MVASLLSSPPHLSSAACHDAAQQPVRLPPSFRAWLQKFGNAANKLSLIDANSKPAKGKEQEEEREEEQEGNYAYISIDSSLPPFTQSREKGVFLKVGASSHKNIVFELCVLALD